MTDESNLSGPLKRTVIFIWINFPLKSKIKESIKNQHSQWEEFLEDKFFGKMEVFFDHVETSFVINEPLPAEIIVTYQGCNQIGYCYLPIKKYLLIDKSLKAIIH